MMEQCRKKLMNLINNKVINEAITPNMLNTVRKEIATDLLDKLNPKSIDLLIKLILFLYSKKRANEWQRLVGGCQEQKSILQT